MTTERNSRRKFLTTSASVAGASFVAVNMPLILAACKKAENNLQSDASYENITLQQAIEFGAIADQIIPVDETPGATQTGVVYFIDAAMSDFMAGAAPMLNQGLEDLQKKVSTVDARVDRFSGLSFEQQTALLKTVEHTRFFKEIHFLTMCGMFCLPRYGGNSDDAGWELLGFDHRHAWSPPFGYYDADIHGSGENQGGDHGNS